MIPLFGSLFPGWIVVVGAAGAGTIALAVMLRGVGLSGAIPFRPVFHLALFLLLAFVFWEHLYGYR